MREVFGAMPRCRMALETGMHSPWVSRLLSELGHETIVAHARNVRLIGESRKKDDRLDARSLARLARIDPQLLSPVKHRSAKAQADLTVIRARAGLVPARTVLINTARGVTKSYGERLRGCNPRNVNPEKGEGLSPELQAALEPLLTAVESLSGLDNFGARYYASTTGRFMSPDWALRPTAVPYAKFGDPQTLNLYTYVENSPMDRVDADGHEQWVGVHGPPKGWIHSPNDDGTPNPGESLYGGLFMSAPAQSMAQNQSGTQSQAQKTDNPNNLVLVPQSDTGQDHVAYREVVYEVERKKGDARNESWYVTEHQTEKSVAPPNGMSGGRENEPNKFPDTIGCLACRNVESQQTFFISRNPGLDAKPQFQITVHVPKVGDFKQVGIHVDSGGNRINNNLHWPGVPFP
jgi:RHS repeat-associated protein